MSLLPAYMSDAWKCYEQMSGEDRASIDPALVNVSPELCHASVLPLLAWESNIDISGLAEATMRQVIRAEINSMQYAGTPGALLSHIEALDLPSGIDEWFEYTGDPYHFKVNLFAVNNPISKETIQKCEKYISRYKNVRSKQEALIIHLASQEKIHFAATIQSGESITVFPKEPTDIEAVVSLPYVGSGVYTIETTTIYPQGA